MKKKKSIIILVSSLLIVSLASYIAFATGDGGKEKSPFDYTMFASSKIQFRGDGTSGGDVWANDFLGYFGSYFKITGNRWSGNHIKDELVIEDPDYTWINNAQKDLTNYYHIGASEKKEMPQIMNVLKENIINDGNYENVKNEDGTPKNLDITQENLSLEKSYIVTGKIEGTVKGDLKNNLIAADDIIITLNNYQQNIDKQDTSKMKPVLIATDKINGKIEISGNSVLVGTIYAPNGTVHFRGSGTYIVGNVVAKNIIVDGSGLYMNDGEKIVFKEDL